VVGSTALGETVDSEALQALLARYFERIRTIVERHGGSVEKFIGDAVMAAFGVPKRVNGGASSPATTMSTACSATSQ
jgi:class 3 adenylate cyclase